MEVSSFEQTEPLQIQEEESLYLTGATCNTYRVRIDGKLYFLKRLKPEYANNPRYVISLKKEYEVGSQLRHPILVQYSLYEQGSIFMDFVKGRSLSQWMENVQEEKKQLSSEHTKLLRRIVLDLLDGLQYLHDQRVLHLDIKPDNILISDLGQQVKLVDLGFCYTDTYDNTKGYTPYFAAPEQLNQGELSEKTDLYAIGRLMGWINEKAKTKVFPPYIIQRCTADIPSRRYAKARLLHNALYAHFHRTQRRLMALSGVALLIAGFAILLHLNSTPATIPSLYPRLHEGHPLSISPDSAHVGVYIMDWDGRLVPAALWDTLYQAQAIAVVDSACQFRMALYNQADSVMYGGIGFCDAICSSDSSYTDQSIIQHDYQGENNTKTHKEFLCNPDTSAIVIAHAFRFPDGTKGYLPAFGEFYKIRSVYFDDVQTALRQCGGDTLRSFYWTSTQHPEIERIWAINVDSINFSFPQLRNDQTKQAKYYGTPLLHVRSFGRLSK